MELIRLPKKPDSVVSALREAILSGNIEPGAELTQVELAASLGVSRMPVREALIILEYQGLVERLPNQHIRVVQTDRRFFEEIFALATAIECRILKADKTAIREISDEMDFHRALYKRMENGLPRKVLETVTEVYIQYGIHCPGYDMRDALSLLRRACSADGAETVLAEYYRKITDTVMGVRKQ